MECRIFHSFHILFSNFHLLLSCALRSLKHLQVLKLSNHILNGLIFMGSFQLRQLRLSPA